MHGHYFAHVNYFVVVLAFYVALDFADSSMPGGLNFNVDLDHDVVLAKVASKIDELVDLRLAQSRPRPAALSLEEH
jgi:hypothetical protein